MTQRTKYFQLRLTQEEYDTLKLKSAYYSSVSHYIRSAIKEYSDIGAKQKLQLLKDLSSFYRKFQDELSWAGGNLNQSVKRANELAVAGLLTPAYMTEVLMPTINRTRKTLESIKLELLNVTKISSSTPTYLSTISIRIFGAAHAFVREHLGSLKKPSSDPDIMADILSKPIKQTGVPRISSRENRDSSVF